MAGKAADHESRQPRQREPDYRRGFPAPESRHRQKSRENPILTRVDDPRAEKLPTKGLRIGFFAAGNGADPASVHRFAPLAPFRLAQRPERAGQAQLALLVFPQHAG